MSNVERVQLLELPTCVRNLRSFLGSVGFYQKLIPHFANVAEPLYALLRGSWRWTPQCMEAFVQLKEVLLHKPILAHFDTGAQTIVECNASDACVTGVLLQVQNGRERPVASCF
jgi:hypothetical protein